MSMSDQTPRTQAEADALLRRTLDHLHFKDEKALEPDIVAYLSRPVADSAGSEGEYRIEAGNDGLLVVGPGDEQWDMSEEDGIESLVDRLNTLSARSDAATQEQVLREALEKIAALPDVRYSDRWPARGKPERGTEIARAALNQDGIKPRSDGLFSIGLSVRHHMQRGCYESERSNDGD